MSHIWEIRKLQTNVKVNKNNIKRSWLTLALCLPCVCPFTVPQRIDKRRILYDQIILQVVSHCHHQQILLDGKNQNGKDNILQVNLGRLGDFYSKSNGEHQTNKRTVSWADLDSNWSVRRRNLSEMESMYTSSCQQHWRHSHNVVLELKANPSLFSAAFWVAGDPARALSKDCAISWNLSGEYWSVPAWSNHRMFQKSLLENHRIKSEGSTRLYWYSTYSPRPQVGNLFQICLQYNILCQKWKLVMVKVIECPNPLSLPHQ